MQGPYDKPPCVNEAIGNQREASNQGDYAEMPLKIRRDACQKIGRTKDPKAGKTNAHAIIGEVR